MPEIHAVTGAFGYTGSRIATQLADRGVAVRTLTSAAPPVGSSESIERRPLELDDEDALTRALEGCSVLHNTYWVRFHAGGFDQERAVERSARLFRAAARAGLRRIVHVGIANPAEHSPYRYFRGKARVEGALRETGLPHSILRPALLFGEGGILVNNIAWLLRRAPLFGIFGDGRYGVRPIHVQDLARLAVVEAGEEGERALDAVGPERFEYRELVATLARALGVRPRLAPMPAWTGWLAAKGLGLLTRDLVLTWEEIGALVDGLLDSDAPATGERGFSDWAREEAGELGLRWASELGRRRAG